MCEANIELTLVHLEPGDYCIKCLQNDQYMGLTGKTDVKLD